MSDQKEREIEEKINTTMARIDSAAGDESSGARKKRSARPQSGTPQTPTRSLKGASALKKESKTRSARPRKITYVPMDDVMQYTSVPEKKKHKGLKVAGLVLAMIAATATAVYAGVSYYYSDRFFEGTVINGIDCSGKTAYEVEKEIAGLVDDYSIQVLSRGQEPQSISGSSIDYHYASDGTVLKLLKEQKPYQWILGYFQAKNTTTTVNTTFDKMLLQSEVKALNCAKEENQVAPENAYVAYRDNQFEIVPETQGSELKVKKAYQVLDEAISGNAVSVDFTDNPDVYEAAAVTSDDPVLQSTLEAYNNFARASITYTFGDQTVTLDGSTIRNWLQFDEKGQLLQDDTSFEKNIAQFVAELAAKYDTVATEREFHTTNGRTVYVYGSAYGWQIDQASEIAQLKSEIQSGAQVTRDPIYSMTANSHGYNDLGNTYIEVDLSDQHMYYYQDGALIFDSDIVSGLMSQADRQTPSGIYTLYYKKSPDVLRGAQRPDGTYEYETNVTYWMPFNGGIGFHDATWQPYFGGDAYLVNGSHGCINLPYDSAAQLYQIIQYNVPIICFY